MFFSSSFFCFYLKPINNLHYPVEFRKPRTTEVDKLFLLFQQNAIQTTILVPFSLVNNKFQIGPETIHTRIGIVLDNRTR